MYSMQLTAVPLNAKSHDDPMQFEYLSLGCVAFSRDGFPEACNLWKQSYFMGGRGGIASVLVLWRGGKGGGIKNHNHQAKQLFISILQIRRLYLKQVFI